MCHSFRLRIHRRVTLYLISLHLQRTLSERGLYLHLFTCPHWGMNPPAPWKASISSMEISPSPSVSLAAYDARTRAGVRSRGVVAPVRSVRVACKHAIHAGTPARRESQHAGSRRQGKFLRETHKHLLHGGGIVSPARVRCLPLGHRWRVAPALGKRYLKSLVTKRGQ